MKHAGDTIEYHHTFQGHSQDLDNGGAQRVSGTQKCTELLFNHALTLVALCGPRLQVSKFA